MPIDSNAQLALMTKAKLVFEDSPDTFLSFPALTPIAYTPDQLNLPGIPSTTQQSLVLQEFATLVNTIPNGTLFDATSGDRLWNIYGNVLGVFAGAADAVQLAQGGLTTGQSADLAQAQAYLYSPGDGGQSVPSPAYTAYSQYQSRWTQANQQLRTGQVSAQNLTDPAALAQWQNTDQPLLLQQVQAAMDDWMNLGNKAAVEQALQVVSAAASRLSPAIVWNGWKNAFQPGLDYLTDPNTNVSYALTAFSPSNAASQSNWPAFSLTASEISQLIAQAPKELANIFGTSAGSSSVAALSFQFCSVVINRAWFNPALFSARFWRFADAGLQLSDGASPPQGRLPAYVKGLILVRNISVTPAAAPAGGGATKMQNFPAVSQFANVRPFLLRPAMLPPPVLHPVQPPAAEAAKPPPPTGLAAETIRVQPRMMMAAPVVRSAPPAPPVALVSRLQAVTFAAPPASSSAPSTTPPDNTAMVSILAFICQRVPKSPDPDPSLSW